MSSVDSLSKLLSILKGLLAKLVAGKMQRDSKIDAGLGAAGKALTATRKYERMRLSAGRDDQRELDIAELWYEAAVALRNVAPRLSYLCNSKKRYWVEPDAWTEDQIQSRGIAIEKMQTEIEALLVGGQEA